ncbi:aspartic peptidase domain-containing protein [Lipomyces japonicus]|uniref:aspartic peptidase domain-containing protein n=1 Tax=Lipomyces japonicus TaxID=56871 RepID=UPI0034CED65F
MRVLKFEKIVLVFSLLLACVPAMASTAGLGSSQPLPHTLEFAIEAYSRTRGGSHSFPRPALQQHPWSVSDNAYDHGTDRFDFTYLLGLSLGQPSAQPVVLQIETGTWDFWVQAAQNPDCKTQELDFCAVTGEFNTGKSSTAHKMALGRRILYDDATYVRMEYYREHLVLANGDVTVPAFTLGVSDESTAVIGRIGLGIALKPPRTRIYDFQAALVQANVTQITSFAWWVGDHNVAHPTGKLLFGGIDKSKFYGELKTVDMIPLTKNVVLSHRLSVETITQVQNKVEYRLDDGRSPFKVTLNPAISWSYFPFGTASLIANKLGSSGFRKDLQAFLISCDRRNHRLQHDNEDYDDAVYNDALRFDFGGGAKITVPVSQLVARIGTTKSGAGVCALTITTAEPTLPEFGVNYDYVIGDNILRYAYVVYDAQNRRISMAQAVKNNSLAGLSVDTVFALGNDGVLPGTTGVPPRVVITKPGFPVGLIVKFFTGMLFLLAGLKLYAVYKDGRLKVDKLQVEQLQVIIVPWLSLNRARFQQLVQCPVSSWQRLRQRLGQGHWQEQRQAAGNNISEDKSGRRIV